MIFFLMTSVKMTRVKRSQTGGASSDKKTIFNNRKMTIKLFIYFCTMRDCDLDYSSLKSDLPAETNAIEKFNNLLIGKKPNALQPFGGMMYFYLNQCIKAFGEYDLNKIQYERGVSISVLPEAGSNTTALSLAKSRVGGQCDVAQEKQKQHPYQQQQQLPTLEPRNYEEILKRYRNLNSNNLFNRGFDEFDRCLVRMYTSSAYCKPIHTWEIFDFLKKAHPIDDQIIKDANATLGMDVYKGQDYAGFGVGFRSSLTPGQFTAFLQNASTATDIQQLKNDIVHDRVTEAHVERFDYSTFSKLLRDTLRKSTDNPTGFTVYHGGLVLLDTIDNIVRCQKPRWLQIPQAMSTSLIREKTEDFNAAMECCTLEIVVKTTHYMDAQHVSHFKTSEAELLFAAGCMLKIIDVSNVKPKPGETPRTSNNRIYVRGEIYSAEDGMKLYKEMLELKPNINPYIQQFQGGGDSTPELQVLTDMEADDDTHMDYLMKIAMVNHNILANPQNAEPEASENPTWYSDCVDLQNDLMRRISAEAAQEQSVVQRPMAPDGYYASEEPGYGSEEPGYGSEEPGYGLDRSIMQQQQWQQQLQRQRLQRQQLQQPLSHRPSLPNRGVSPWSGNFRQRAPAFLQRGTVPSGHQMRSMRLFGGGDVAATAWHRIATAVGVVVMSAVAVAGGLVGEN